MSLRSILDKSISVEFDQIKCNLHKNDGWEEQESLLIYDENHSKITLEDITSNDFITPLLVVEGILFTGSTFEIIFTLNWKLNWPFLAKYYVGFASE